MRRNTVLLFLALATVCIFAFPPGGIILDSGRKQVPANGTAAAGGGANPDCCFVSTTGIDAAAGDISNPRSLRWSLTNTVDVPGTTNWLLPGTYSIPSNSVVWPITTKGTPSLPIVFRNYTNGLAIIDAGQALRFTTASNTYLWGLVARSSAKTNANWFSSWIESTGGKDNKLINIVGVEFNQFAEVSSATWDIEFYGGVLYAGGNSSLAHCWYVQGTNGDHPRLITDNLSGGCTEFPVHFYAGGVGAVNGCTMVGNTIWNPAYIRNTADAAILTGGNAVENFICKSNVTYNDGKYNGGAAATIGYAGTASTNEHIYNNYFIGYIAFNTGAEHLDLDFGTNYVYARSSKPLYFGVAPSPGTWDRNDLRALGASLVVEVTGTNYTFSQWTNNYLKDINSTYAESVGITNKVFIQPNKYEVGRGHVTILNGASNDVVAVDLSSILSNGDTYVVKNPQDYFGSNVLSGTYTSGTVNFPMTNLAAAALAYVFTGSSNPPAFGKEFAAFVVIKQ